MLRYICLILLCFFCTIDSYSQSLLPPKNLNFNKLLSSDYLPNALRISWDSVPQAVNYLVDVANDSSFTKPVFGLQNFPQTLGIVFYSGEYRTIYTEQLELGSTGMVLFNRCNTQLFTRVRAINIKGEKGGYSSTASIRLQSQPCIPSPPPLPDTIIGSLQRKSVSYYEGPLPYTRGNFQGKGVVYYFSPSALPEFYQFNPDSLQKLNSQSNESLIQLLENHNIPIDTAWCHAEGQIELRYPTLQGPGPFATRSLFVKLLRPDIRMKGFGFADSLPFTARWQYADNFNYYLYTRNTTSSVVMSEVADSHYLKFYPQPCGEEGIISYSLLQPDNVQIQLFNALGVLVHNIFTGWQLKGEYHISLNTQNFPSGTYFLRISIGNGRNNNVFKSLPINITH